MDAEFYALRKDYRDDNSLDFLPVIIGDENGNVIDPVIPGNILIRYVVSNSLFIPHSVGAPASKMDLSPGTPVELETDRFGNKRIKGYDPKGILISGGSPYASVTDTAKIRQQDFSTLLPIPTAPASTTIKLKGWQPIIDNVFTPFSGEIDLASLIPSAGNMAWIVVAVDSSFTVVAESSTPVPLGDVLDQEDAIQEAIDALVALDPLNTYVWALLLQDDQSTITQEDFDNGLDLRQAINSYVGGTFGNVIGIARGGTGQTSKTPAFDALAPGTTRGDLIVYDGTDNVRKAVGSNTDYLRPNSNINDGLEWSKIPFSMAGRLSPSGTKPVYDENSTNLDTIYWHPFNGARVRLRDANAVYTYYDLPDSPVSASLAGLLADTNYDVFGYVSSGAPALELVAWSTPTIINVTSITNASPPVATTGSAHGYTTGDIIRIQGNTAALNNDLWRVGTTPTTTTFQLLNLDNSNPAAPGSAGTGGTTNRADQQGSRVTAINYTGGVYEKDGDNTRLYLGTIRTYETGKTAILTKRLSIWNYFNRVPISLFIIEDAVSWTYATSTWRASNNNFDNRIWFVIGVPFCEYVRAESVSSMFTNNDAGSSSIALDATNVTSAFTISEVAESTSSSTIAVVSVSQYGDYIDSVGFHYLQMVEITRTGTVTFRGSPFPATGNVMSGMTGELMW